MVLEGRLELSSNGVTYLQNNHTLKHVYIRAPSTKPQDKCVSLQNLRELIKIHVQLNVYAGKVHDPVILVTKIWWVKC